MDYIIGSGSNGRGAAFGGDSSLREFEGFDSSMEELLEERSRDFEQLAIVFSQASTPETGEVWKNYLTSAIVGGVAAYSIYSVIPSPIKKGVGGGLAKVGSVFTAKGAAIVGTLFAIAAGAIQVNVWNNQALTASYCGDLTSSDGSKKGCSVVRVMPYNATELSTFCGVIDGLP